MSMSDIVDFMKARTKCKETVGSIMVIGAAGARGQSYLTSLLMDHHVKMKIPEYLILVEKKIRNVSNNCIKDGQNM